jgi:hypothetical protein
MVTATAWALDEQDCNGSKWRSKANLFSAGFDRVAFGWSVKSAATTKEDVKMSNGDKKEATF